MQFSKIPLSLARGRGNPERCIALRVPFFDIDGESKGC
jgi:hypothetical protein